MTESAPCPADVPSVESGSPSALEQPESEPSNSLLAAVLAEFRLHNALLMELVQQNSILIQSLADESDENDERESTYLDGSRRT